MSTPCMVLYECGICGEFHPWNWDGDCRDDANRYGGPDDYAKKLGVSEFDIEVRTMEERVAMDAEMPAKTKPRNMRGEPQEPQ